MKTLLLTLLLLLLSGCTMKENSLKPYNYTLEPNATLERAKNANHDILKIARIESPSGLNTRAILYKQEGATQPYKYGTWSETPPLKLQYLITEALQEQNHFESVVTGSTMASHNLVLEPVLQNFEEIFKPDGRSYVLISLRFRLVEIKTGEVLGSIKIASTKDVTNTNGAAGSVEAFNEASRDLITRLAQWLYEVRK